MHVRGRAVGLRLVPVIVRDGGAGMRRACDVLLSLAMLAFVFCYIAGLALGLGLALSGCGDDASEPSDEPSGCVCDAFGPPGIFDPSTCDDGRECCDADEDGKPDAAPTRLVCFGGGGK